MSTIKQRILDVKTEAIIEAVNTWAKDNGIRIDTPIEYPLEGYIKTTLSEME